MWASGRRLEDLDVLCVGDGVLQGRQSPAKLRTGTWVPLELRASWVTNEKFLFRTPWKLKIAVCTGFCIYVTGESQTPGNLSVAPRSTGLASRTSLVFSKTSVAAAAWPSSQRLEADELV